MQEPRSRYKQNNAAQRKVFGKPIEKMLSAAERNHCTDSTDSELQKDQNKIDNMATSNQCGHNSIFETQADIPIDQIVSNRPSRNIRSLDRLCKSINDDDVIHPIVVVKIAAGYEVVCGHRRFQASRKLHRKTISARVLKESVSLQDRHKLRLVENIDRDNFKPIELAITICEYLDESLPGLDINGKINLFNNDQRKSQRPADEEATVTSVKHITGRSASTLKNLLSILKLPAKQIHQIENRMLGTSQAYILAAHTLHPRFESIAEEAVTEKLKKSELVDLFETSGGKEDVFVKGSLRTLENLERKIRLKVNQISSDGTNDLLKKLHDLCAVIEGNRKVD